MACKSELKHRCGDRSANARCVFYDLDKKPFSKLYPETCTTVEETTEDLYNLVAWLRESVDVKGVNLGSLEVDAVQDSYRPEQERYLIKDILNGLISQIDDIRNVANSNDTSNGLELDFKCLTTSCGDPINSLKDLLQTLIDEVCYLRNTIK